MTQALRASLVAKYHELSNSIDVQRKPGTRTLPLSTYVGRYWNQLHNFVLDINLHSKHEDVLKMAFQGLEAQTYDLRHLADDTFEWSLTLDEEAIRGRFHNWQPGYYMIAFLTSGSEVRELN